MDLERKAKYILTNGPLQKKKKKKKTNNEMKRGAPKGDEYVVSLYLRQKVGNL